MRTNLSTTFAVLMAIVSSSLCSAAPVVYISAANAIDMISPTGVITPFVVGEGLDSPYGLTFNTSGDLFVADEGNSTISEISPTGSVAQFASGGGLNRPFGLAFNAQNDLFATNYYAGTISEIYPSGAVTTFASGLTNPASMAFDAEGNMYVAQSAGQYAVVKISSNGVVTPFVLSGGYGGNGLFNMPYGMAINSSGTIFVSDATTSSVESITPSGGVSNFVASGGVFDPDSQMEFGPDGNLYAAALNYVYQVSPTGVPTEFADTSQDGIHPTGLAIPVPEASGTFAAIIIIPCLGLARPMSRRGSRKCLEIRHIFGA